MVELSTILDSFPGKQEIILDLSRLIKGHGINAYLCRSSILSIVSGEEDEEAFIDVLIDQGVLGSLKEIKTCCNSPFIDTDYCFSCGEKNDFEMRTYYQVLKLIKFSDEWRKNIQEELGRQISLSDYEYVNLICSQVRSLDRNPVIPKSDRSHEKQYQFIGYRILSHLYETEMECLTEDGRSDLKFKKPSERIDYVGEYKIWSRRSKTDLVVNQCLNYFNSDTESGFVFMVNDLKSKDIWDDYITNHVKCSTTYLDFESMGFLVNRDKYGVSIYHSMHLCPTTAKKTSVYHFIYDLHGNFGGR